MSSRTEVRSPTRTEVRSPTRTSTRANTRGNFTSTVTGGAGAGETSVTINIPSQTPHDTGSLNHYPIVMGGDTGALNGDGQRILVSSVGGIAGLLVSKSLVGAVIGAGMGYLLSHTDPVQNLFK